MYIPEDIQEAVKTLREFNGHAAHEFNMGDGWPLLNKVYNFLLKELDTEPQEVYNYTLTILKDRNQLVSDLICLGGSKDGKDEQLAVKCNTLVREGKIVHPEARSRC